MIFFGYRRRKNDQHDDERARVVGREDGTDGAGKVPGGWARRRGRRAGPASFYLMCIRFLHLIYGVPPCYVVKRPIRSSNLESLHKS